MQNKLLEEIKKLHINPSRDIIKSINDEWEIIEERINLLKSFDITNVKPMTRIDNTPIDFLREDIPLATLSQNDFLSNAKVSKDELIAINKVVKND